MEPKLFMSDHFIVLFQVRVFFAIYSLMLSLVRKV
jgi:hypothetical protein